MSWNWVELEVTRKTSLKYEMMRFREKKEKSRHVLGKFNKNYLALEWKIVDKNIDAQQLWSKYKNK